METDNKRQNIYQYLQSLDITGESTGIDAVTITATGLGGKLVLGFILNEFAEELSVESEQKFYFKGASGFARGPFRYASKWDGKQSQLWAILMVTGEISDKVFNHAITYNDGGLRYTRLDLRCDIKLSEVVTDLAHRLYLGNKHKVEAKYYASITGDTVYFGKRENSAFVRVYDKSLEYGEQLGTVWRFELEAKKEFAHNVAMLLSNAADSKLTRSQVDDIIQNILWGKMKEMGLPTPKQGDFPNIRMTQVTLTSNEMKLAWLRSRVRGTVRGLIAAGEGRRVEEALGVQLALDIETV